MENTSETHYVYGASVQGIQSFIFQTNELKDIVGASELVENVCTTAFKEMVGESFQEESAIVMAAGNIKYCFKNKELCQKVVCGFPKKVMEMAPGITISQAVVKYVLGKNTHNQTNPPSESEEKCFSDFPSAVQELENRLRTQRNKPMRSMTLGSIGIIRSRKTGLPAIQYERDEAIDLATAQKRKNAQSDNNSTFQLCKKIFGKGISPKDIAYDLNKITDTNSWIAIIHADGNGLGQVVQTVGTDPNIFRLFSINLDKATTFAAQNAYKRLNLKLMESERIPMRPIVLGGDDLTVICRANMALDFTHYFLEEFEYTTGRKAPRTEPVPGMTAEQIKEQQNVAKTLQGILEKKKVFHDGSAYLSACAGIAYIKSSYPFYYGYELAETLCTEAKKEAKLLSKGMEYLPPSCLMFHKVQSSFVEEFSQIARKELTAGTQESPISFQFGPYYLSEQQKDELGKRWSIQTLKKKLKLLQDSPTGKSVKNHLRECTNLLIHNPELAKQKLERLKVLTENEKELTDFITEIIKLLKAGSPTERRIPIYDLLSLHSVQYQITQKK